MRWTLLVGVLALSLVIAVGSTGAERGNEPGPPQTLEAPIPRAPLEFQSLPALVREGIPPTVTVTPMPVPTATPVPLEACKVHPDRYNWRPYAIAAGFPDWVLSELAGVIRIESRGDLCAINSSSGATCWIQQYPGGEAFLGPGTCMAQGFAKWKAGGQDFWQHWYQWWAR